MINGVPRTPNGTPVKVDVDATATQLKNRFVGKDATIANRKAAAAEMTNEYYNLVTKFYEFGWGRQFHFATRYKGEGFMDSLLRHEIHLAIEAGFRPGMKLLDVGCGVGGPARNISRFTRSKVVAVNNNDCQIYRIRKLNHQEGLEKCVECVKCDFSKTPFPDNTFDGAYDIEAICHSGDKAATFAEIYRVLKPGASLACFDWVLTKKYDDNNEEHREVRHGIEMGNGLPTLETEDALVQALRKAGFQVELCYDLVEVSKNFPAEQIPWYEPLKGGYSSLQTLRASNVGRILTATVCRVTEALRLAPKGTSKTTALLDTGDLNLVKGGELGIFTPCLFIKAKKPEKKQ